MFVPIRGLRRSSFLCALCSLALSFAATGCDGAGDDGLSPESASSTSPSSEPGGTSGGSASPGSGDETTRGSSVTPGTSQVGPTEPGPTEPGPTEPGPTEPGPTEPSVTDPGPSDWPADVFRISLDENGRASFEGTFSGAAPLPSVEWAREPAVACWSNPNTDEFYSAGHVGVVLDAPVDEWSEITVTVTPTTSGGEANLYVLQLEADRFDAPPTIARARYCHQPVTFGSPNEASSVTFRTYAGQQRNLYIGVSSRGRFQPDGDFRLDVEVTPLAGEERCYDELPAPAGWGDHVRRVALGADGTWSATGRLEDGAPACALEFLNRAFCAPTTQVDNFAGHHVFHALDAPIPANSVLTVTVTPDPDVAISLYGARQGTTSFEIPPRFALQGCESSLQHPGRAPGRSESISFVATTNPYNIFFAVAGDDVQGGEGGYTVTVELVSTSTDDCTPEDYAAVSNLTDWPSNVARIAVDPDTNVGIARGDLTEGELQCTLDWAARSSVACFPIVQREYFDGRHQFFALDPPPPAGSNVTVTVFPDEDVDVSLYGWRTGVDRFLVPPFVPSVVNCEASYPRAALTRPTNPGEPEQIRFLNPTSNAYGYFIGVAGIAGEILQGGYTVEVQVELPPPPHCPESLPGSNYGTWPGFVQLVDLPEGGVATGSGDLADGRCMNLDFASRSDVACFPATRNDHFEGNHLFYALDRPIPPRSEVVITVTPEPGVVVSTYGFQLGSTEFRVPPNVANTLCRASYGLAGPNPGESEVLRFQNPTDTNLYNIFFAVAGDAATGTSGGFTWEVRETVAVTHCPESLDADPVDDTLPESVERITLIDGQAQGSASLGDGSCVNLDFASRSDVACFPATRNDRFEGHHLFFELTDPVPPNSVVDIEVRPRDGADVNLYGFLMGDARWPQLPPFVSNANCEASYGFGPPNPGEVSRIQFRNPSANTFRVLFAAAGPAGVTDAAFDYAVRMETADAHCPESLPGETFSAWPSEVTTLALPSAPGAVTTASANINDGACVNLDFASRSDVACFPATWNGYFDGDQLFYALADPLPPRASVAIRLTPEATGTLALYGMRMPEESFIVPPRVPPVPCEASSPSLFEGPNPGETEEIVLMNPSFSQSANVFFAVAGGTAASVGSGAFTLEVERLD
ncbi:MAG: hypothetical protein EA398_14650 [Deltaproteobacteria bacterium]|nr:MAG: hypothetical protein EA398_14650 [Deltaproteobacteria bacterium]